MVKLACFAVRCNCLRDDTDSCVASMAAKVVEEVLIGNAARNCFKTHTDLQCFEHSQMMNSIASYDDHADAPD